MTQYYGNKGKGGGAPPARWIGEVDRVNECVEVADVHNCPERPADHKRPFGSAPYWVSIAALSAQEATKVAAALGIGDPRGVTWNTGCRSREGRIAAIRVALHNGSPWRPINAHGAPRPSGTPTLLPPPPTVIPGSATPTITIDGNVATVDYSGTTDEPTPRSDVDLSNYVTKPVYESAIIAIDDEYEALKAEVDDLKKIQPSFITVQAPTFPTVEFDITEGHAMLGTVVKYLAMEFDPEYGESPTNLWLGGPAGSGKSSLVKSAAKVLGLPFYVTACHGMMTEAKLIGFVSPIDGKYVASQYRLSYDDEYGAPGVMLWDEIDTANAILTSLNSAMDNGGCAFADKYVSQSLRNRCCATANTFGMGATAKYVSRNKIDAASTDRFTMVGIDYDRALEERLCRRYLEADACAVWIATIERYRQNIATHELEVVMGTRAKVEGARQLAHGFTTEEVMAGRVLRKLSADIVAKVTA